MLLYITCSVSGGRTHLRLVLGPSRASPFFAWCVATTSTNKAHSIRTFACTHCHFASWDMSGSPIPDHPWELLQLEIRLVNTHLTLFQFRMRLMQLTFNFKQHLIQPNRTQVDLWRERSSIH